MTINLTVPKKSTELSPRIVVFGIGGAGGNAVNNMIRSDLYGVDFVVANTDAQALAQSQAERQLQLGVTITEGLGAGSRPDIGRAAAEECLDDILDSLEGTHMTFITAGMGGGTGTGAAPVIARAARERGILTVGVVTKPFHFEGQHRMKIAEDGIEELQQYVDTLIIIPNQNLFRVANEKTTFADAFKMADDVLYSGVRGVTDLMVMPGLINLDFADIRTVMSEMGKAMMGTGEADGEGRAIKAAEAAISNPLLDEISMKGARGVLINITGGMDLTLFEVDEAANRIREEVDPNANIIFGSTFEDGMENIMRVSVVATGIDANVMVKPRSTTISLVTERKAPREIETPAAAPAVHATTAAHIAKAPAMTSGATALAMDMRSAPEAEEEQALAETGAIEANEFDIPEPSPMLEPVAVEVDNEPDELILDAPLDEPDEDDMAFVARIAADPAGDWQGPEEGFVAPPPVEPARRPIPEFTPDPFAAAELANATPPEAQVEKRNSGGRAGSLFRRVTQAARDLTDAVEHRAPAKPRSEPTLSDSDAQQPGAAVKPKNEPRPVQPRLGGLDSVERKPSAQDDEDMLEIPAFLRRQAN